MGSDIERLEVSALNWTVRILGDHETAMTPFGYYVVRRVGISNPCEFAFEVKGIAWWREDGFLTLALAREAAQADFEKRVRACLCPGIPPQQDASGLPNKEQET